MFETECTGDYGLSDCLLVTQDAEDYADAWFSNPGDGTRPSSVKC